jgi:RNA polymerase sigma factor (sigma-70 family)
MTFSLNRDEEILRIVETYSNTIFKISLVILCNVADAEDAVQNTFLKYITKAPVFRDGEHEKAWFIKVSTNLCIDMCRFRKRHVQLNIDDFQECYHSEENWEILKSMMELSKKYKIVLYLYYIYGYKTDEIARMLKILPSTVRKRLQYGRQLLRIEYGEERYHEGKAIY